ncbi:histidinol-phosphate transaminase [Nibricoccus sp. IMCC34717]|uniref:histidinol-phosphate transaminase n=1 Tax=Nibricoccus sp. IMCC34717 TaxID=3034021 RepID=UPI0038513427
MTESRTPPPLPHIARLHAYTPGLQPGETGWVKLNTNECPYPPSPRVAAAIAAEVGDGTRLRLYPNPESRALRETIARVHGHGLRPENVCVGNGSDDILNLLVRAYCGDGYDAGWLQPSYSLYPVLVAIQNGKLLTVPFDRSLRLPVEAIATSGAQVFFLTSPNAPTGVGFSQDEIAAVAKRFPGLLVVDEAYAPFAKENAVALLAAHPNVLIARTLSKAQALAGIRVGYALAHPDVIGMLDRVRDSYNVNRLSQAAAIAAISDVDYYTGIIDKVRQTRDFYAQEWANRGWFVYPSQANFLFVEVRNAKGEAGAAVARSAYDFLYRNKVLVRYFGSHALTESFLRITVGTDEEMLTLDETLQSWLKNAP